MKNKRRAIRIDRTKWQRGPHDGRTYLWNKYRQEGCCLGHVIHQTQKHSWNSLDLKADPFEVLKKQDVCKLVTDQDINSEFANKAIEINDSIYLTEYEREEQLIELFKKNKIKLSFHT